MNATKKNIRIRTFRTTAGGGSLGSNICRHREYKGCTIWFRTEPGFALRWTAMTSRGQVAADTLAGIKELIREG